MKRKMFCLAAVLLLGGLLTGCGKNTTTMEAMQQLEELSYETALYAFDKAEEEGENARLIARGRGIAYFGLTQYEQAVECFTQALALSNGFLQPIDYDINYYLGASYSKLGRYEEALGCYDAIIGLQQRPDAYTLRGAVKLHMGAYEDALSDFNQAIALSPTDYDQMVEIYEALAECGYRSAGLDYLQTALNEGEKDMSSLDRGKIYYYMGEYQAAAVALEDARKNGDSVEASLYLGKSYEAVGEYNYASNVYESYLAKDETAASLYNQLGLCQMKMKNYVGALASFQAGMQIGDVTIQQDLAFNEIVAYEYMGEFQKASVLVSNYLQSYPGDETARREQSFLASR